MNEELMRRAEELLEKLTLEEKIGMIHGAELFATKGVERRWAYVSGIVRDYGAGDYKDQRGSQRGDQTGDQAGNHFACSERISGFRR